MKKVVDDFIVIVDASVTISWIAADEKSDYAATLMAIANDSALVPAIWHWETANVLLVLETRSRLASAVLTFFQCDASAHLN